MGTGKRVQYKPSYPISRGLLWLPDIISRRMSMKRQPKDLLILPIIAELIPQKGYKTTINEDGYVTHRKVRTKGKKPKSERKITQNITAVTQINITVNQYQATIKPTE
jgi:hypothetical protein